MKSLIISALVLSSAAFAAEAKKEVKTAPKAVEAKVAKKFTQSIKDTSQFLLR